MKRFLAAVYLAVAAAFLLPLLLSPGERSAAAPPRETPGATAAPDGAGTDAALTLTLLTGDGPAELSMEDYLLGALAGEMPASFEPEALKAQAVALRTYALHYRESRKDAHPDADVCVEPACCAAWLSEEERAARWGGDAAQWTEKLAAAVRETDGQVLCWEERPILAVFHASSQGSTESGAALGVDAPYLQSVPTPETPAAVPSLDSTVEVSPEDFAATLRRLLPGAELHLSGDPADWLGPVTLDAAGRAERVSVGGAEASALALRQAFSLRSTDFTLAYDGEKFVFRVRGYGHGLGLSQHGANLMAKDGADFRAILAHYYPGTELRTAQQSAGAGTSVF